MAGAGYKLFNTGDVLTAAQVNTYLQEQVVMRFATTAARTTALSGVLAEGMVSYIDATDSVEVYNGTAWVSIGSSGDITAVTTAANSGLTGGATSGDVALRINTTAKGSIIAGTGAATLGELTVGANNTILTADSTTATGLKWSTASAGGLTQLATGSLSGASVSITSISGSYKDLRLIIREYKPATDAKTLNLRFNADSGANRHAQVTVSGAVENQTFNSTFCSISWTADNSVATNLVDVLIPDYANTTTWKYLFTQALTVNATTTSNYNFYFANAVYNQTAAITSLSLFPDSGNFTSGTYILYGVS